VEQTVVLESDPSAARSIARRFAADYLRTPNYANNLKRMGWADHVCIQVVAEDQGDAALPQLRELAPALLGL
jgi:hypothetical protein